MCSSKIIMWDCFVDPARILYVEWRQVRVRIGYRLLYTATVAIHVGIRSGSVMHWTLTSNQHIVVVRFPALGYNI